jgi:3-oxoacyl-[acyl-carrier protein] reductase
MNIMIAGASGGVGNYLTEQFDVGGNLLYLTYNSSRDKLFPVTKAQSIIHKCDFTNSKDVELVFSQITSLDVLINTMGHVENNLIKNMEEGEWDRVIASNLKTIFLSCKSGVSKMVDNGHIINISSVLGDMGMIGATNYVAAKGAVEAFTKSFALECLMKRRIFVNSISLGYFKTGLGLKLTDKIHKIICEKIPLKEFGEPEEIMKAVNYIISSRYMVGQILHINGGLMR